MTTWDIYKAGGVIARTILSPAGTNNDIAIYAKAAGPDGNNLTAEITVSGNHTKLQVQVTKGGTAITVKCETDTGGVPVSTAAQVIAALNSDPITGPLVYAENAPGHNGSGVVAAVTPQAFTGGSDADPSFFTPSQAATLRSVGVTVEAPDDQDAVRQGAPAAGTYVALPRELTKKFRIVSGSPPYTRAQVTQAAGY